MSHIIHEDTLHVRGPYIHVEGPYVTYSICLSHETGFGKETMRFRISVIFVYLAWMLADAQMNYGGSSVHVQWFSH